MHGIEPRQKWILYAVKMRLRFSLPDLLSHSPWPSCHAGMYISVSGPAYCLWNPAKLGNLFLLDEWTTHLKGISRAVF